MAECKVQPCPLIACSEKWSFFLDYSLHAMLFKVAMGCLGGEGLVCDALKSLGDLNSIINLSRADKMLFKANIG